MRGTTVDVTNMTRIDAEKAGAAVLAYWLEVHGAKARRELKLRHKREMALLYARHAEEMLDPLKALGK